MAFKRPEVRIPYAPLLYDKLNPIIFIGKGLKFMSFVAHVLILYDLSNSCHIVARIKLEKILLDLIATSDPDPTFERPAEIPWEVTTPREAFVRKAVIEKIEDEIDIELARKALAEYEADPFTYTHDEVGRMLGLK